jgi:hypothetical protein
MNLSYSREALIDALESRRQWAKAYDKKQAAQHKKEEAAYLAKFREACRTACQWNYATARDKGFSIPGDFGRFGTRPKCPRVALKLLDATLNRIRLDGRKRYSVEPSNHMSEAYWLLTHDENTPPDLCQ